MTGRAILRPGRLLPLLLFAPAGLLFLPVFYYSLNTPFGLVDDYSIWKWTRIFDGVVIQQLGPHPYGAHFYRDGKCLALLPPPGYAVSQVRTGQFAPGQVELWSAGFAMPGDGAALTGGWGDE